jgi:hypothetical protein
MSAKLIFYSISYTKLMSYRTYSFSYETIKCIIRDKNILDFLMLYSTKQNSFSRFLEIFGRFFRFWNRMGQRCFRNCKLFRRHFLLPHAFDISSVPHIFRILEGVGLNCFLVMSETNTNISLAQINACNTEPSK